MDTRGTEKECPICHTPYTERRAMDCPEIHFASPGPRTGRVLATFRLPIPVDQLVVIAQWIDEVYADEVANEPARLRQDGDMLVIFTEDE